MTDWRDRIVDSLNSAEQARNVAAVRLARGVRPPDRRQVGELAERPASTLANLVIPQTPLDVALLAAGPGGLAARVASPAVRAGAIALGGALTGDEAQAGPRTKVAKALLDKLAAARAAAVEAPAIGGKGPLFDYSRMGEVPDVPQFLLQRYDPPRGVSERAADLISDPKARRAVSAAIDRGVKAGAHQFYHNKPLLEAYQDELGEKAGAEAYRRYIDYVSATSVRSDVPTNVRNASYYYWLDRQGQKILPWEKAPGNPEPYGHLAQQNQRRGAVEVQQGGWDVIKNPKPPSFAENLAGNLMPVTVDAHAIKLPAMSIRDPRWLATSLKEAKDEPLIYPQRMVASGQVSMDEAVKHPTWWVPQPNPNEYAALEQFWTEIARKKGLAPGQGQAGGWTGGGALTGNRSSTLENVDPFLKVYEDRVRHTADEMGITPRTVMKRQIRGELPLLSVGGAAAVAPGVLPRDDNMSEMFSQDRLQQ